MGLLDSLSSFLSFSEPTYVDAEAADPPKDDGKDEDVKEDKDEGDKEEGEKEESDDDAPDPPAQEEEAEEEEEEEELQDPKEKLEAECMDSSQCKKYKTHYDHCAERVEKQHEKTGKAHEDCVEEFFELAHCAANCAAPKLWKQLK